MSAILTLLLVWFVISIPVAFFVGAVFTLSKRSEEVEANSEMTQTIEATQDTL